MESRQISVESTVLREADAAKHLGLSVRTLQKRRQDGLDPQYVKIGKCVRYRTTDLDAFLAGNLVRPFKFAPGKEAA